MKGSSSQNEPVFFFRNLMDEEEDEVNLPMPEFHKIESPAKGVPTNLNGVGGTLDGRVRPGTRSSPRKDGSPVQSPSKSALLTEGPAGASAITNLRRSPVKTPEKVLSPTKSPVKSPTKQAGHQKSPTKQLSPLKEEELDQLMMVGTKTKPGPAAAGGRPNRWQNKAAEEDINSEDSTPEGSRVAEDDQTEPATLGKRAPRSEPLQNGASKDSAGHRSGWLQRKTHQLPEDAEAEASNGTAMDAEEEHDEEWNGQEEGEEEEKIDDAEIEELLATVDISNETELKQHILAQIEDEFAEKGLDASDLTVTEEMYRAKLIEYIKDGRIVLNGHSGDEDIDGEEEGGMGGEGGEEFLEMAEDSPPAAYLTIRRKADVKKYFNMLNEMYFEEVKRFEQNDVTRKVNFKKKNQVKSKSG